MNKHDRDTQIRALMLESAGFDVDEIAEKLQLAVGAVRQILGHRPTLSLKRQGNIY